MLRREHLKAQCVSIAVRHEGRWEMLCHEATIPRADASRNGR